MLVRNCIRSPGSVNKNVLWGEEYSEHIMEQCVCVCVCARTYNYVNIYVYMFATQILFCNNKEAVNRFRSSWITLNSPIVTQISL